MTIAGSAARRRAASRNLWLLCLSLFLWRCGSAQIIFLQPVYLRLLGAGPVQIGLALSVQAVASLISLLPGGYLSNRFPRKTLMLLSWGVGVTGILAMAGAGNWPALVGAMAIFGLSGFGNPATSHYLAELDTERPAWSFALLTASTQFGTVISPVIGAYLAQTYSPRAAYLVSAAFCALSTLVLTALSRQSAGGRPSLRDAFRPLVRDPILVAIVLPLLVGYSAAALAEAFASNFLRDVAGLSLATIGRMGSAWALGAAVISLLAGRLTRRRSRLGATLAGCFGLTCLGLTLMIGVPGLPGIAGGLATFAFGVAFFLRGADLSGRALINAHLAQSLGRESMGVGFALTNTVLALAQILAPPVAGWLYSGRPTAPFFAALVALPMAGSVLVWHIRRDSPRVSASLDTT